MLTGDKNDLRIESFLRSQGLKQIVKFPTTKGNTKLDVICTNLSEYYNEPQDLPADDSICNLDGEPENDAGETGSMLLL